MSPQMELLLLHDHGFNYSNTYSMHAELALVSIATKTSTPARNPLALLSTSPTPHLLQLIRHYRVTLHGTMAIVL